MGDSTRCRRNKTKRTKGLVLVVAMLAVAGAEELQATTIQIDLGSPGTYTGANAQLGPISFSDLNGTPVNGSSLSIDFFFTNNEFVRLFASTTPFFDVRLNLVTNAGTFPGLLTAQSDYLIAEDGSAIPGFGIVGRADGSNGSTSIGFFPLLEDANGTPNPNLTFPLDFYGVHFGFTLPNDTSVSVINGDFTLSGAPFAVGPHVPDTGSTWLLFLIGASGLLAARTVTQRKKI